MARLQNLFLFSSVPFDTYLSKRSNHIFGYAGFVRKSLLSTPANPGSAALGAGEEIVYVRLENKNTVRVCTRTAFREYSNTDVACDHRFC
jgi:hypothetical protein